MEKKEVFIRPIQEKEDDAVYQMFQDIPATQNDATNRANGLSRIEFDTFCKKMTERSIAAANGRKKFSDNRIPQTIYIIFDNDVPVGFGKFRPFLNEACIKIRAGHFGYMISTKYQGKGYATKLLSFLKEEARKIGLQEIEGVARKKNSASCRVMEKNGGKIKEHIDKDVVYTIALQTKTR